MAGLPERALESAYEVYGRHPGRRALHAKGMFCEGTFTANREAAELTTAEHMQGGEIPALIRFSKGSGDPGWPDAARDTRGMAVKLHLPSGSDTDLVAATLPSFFVRRPEDFPDVTRSLRPWRSNTRVPNLLRVGWYALRHRESAQALWAVFTIKPALSFATSRYNAVHAYRWIGPSGRVRHVRYSWVPEAGEVDIARKEADARGPDYLRDELAERLEAGPARFTLRVQIAEEGDPVDDPTAAWPAGREAVDVATLAVERLVDPERPGTAIAMDPTRITDGIELSDDPVLRFRPQAYALSAERRSAATAPPNST